MKQASMVNGNKSMAHVSNKQANDQKKDLDGLLP